MLKLRMSSAVADQIKLLFRWMTDAAAWYAPVATARMVPITVLDGFHWISSINLIRATQTSGSTCGSAVRRDSGRHVTSPFRVASLSRTPQFFKTVTSPAWLNAQEDAPESRI